MWKNEYKTAVEKISATDAWKQETIAAMQAEQQEKKQVAFPKKKMISVAVAACLCLAVVPVGMMLLRPNGSFSTTTENTVALAPAEDAAMPAAAPTAGTNENAAGVAEETTIAPKAEIAMQSAAGAALPEQSVLQGRVVWQQGMPWQESVTLYTQDTNGIQSAFETTPIRPESAEAQLSLAANETVKDVYLLAVYTQTDTGGMQEQLLYRFMVQNTETTEETSVDIVVP